MKKYEEKLLSRLFGETKVTKEEVRLEAKRRLLNKLAVKKELLNKLKEAK